MGIQLSHRVDEGVLQVDINSIGKADQRPQAVGELVTELAIEVSRSGPVTPLRLHKLDKVTDVTDEAKCKILDRPSATIARPLELRES